MSKFNIEVTKLTQVGTNWVYRRIGQIDTYLSLDVIVRYNDVGTWTFNLMDGTAQAALLQPGTGVVIWCEGLDQPIMSGPLRQIDRTWGIDDSGAGSVTYSGVDDNTIFADHICMPDPGNGLSVPDASNLNGYRQSVPYYGDATPQSLERLIYSLAWYNLGPGNTAGRALKGITVPAQASWPLVTAYPRTTYKLRFEAILEALRTRTDVATDATGAKVPIGWRWLWDKPSGTIQLSTFHPFNDPTQGKSVRFSQEIGNLKSYAYTLIAPKADWYLLGLDQETDQKPETQNLWISDQRSSDTDWAVNAEVYSEHTDVSLLKRDANGLPIVDGSNKRVIDTDAINTAVAADVSSNGASGSLSIEPIDTVGCKFGRDYWLGDLVTVVVDGTEITDVLREVHLTDDASNGPLITPTIGSQTASQTPEFYAEVKRIWDAVNRAKRLKQGNRFG